VIVLLSTSDTDLLSARASGAAYRLANPARLAVPDLPPLLDGATAVVVRILGGRQAWADGLDAVTASGVPTIVLGGEVTPDAELMRLSTVPGGVVAEAHAYLAHGGELSPTPGAGLGGASGEEKRAQDDAGAGGAGAAWRMRAGAPAVRASPIRRRTTCAAHSPRPPP